MNQYKFLVVFFLVLSFSLINLSSARADIVEGKDYTVLATPQPTQDGSCLLYTSPSPRD